MTLKINKYFLQLLLFLIVFQSVFSQEKKNTRVPLQEILTAISNQHGVEFNSIDDEISIFKLTPPSATLSLTEKLNYIRQNTLLSIEVLDEKYITISDKKLLCGYVFDATTNKPIENAILKFPNENQSVVSQENGYFKFHKYTVTDIHISCMGYTSITITAKSLLQENCPKIYLNPFIEPLTEVIAQHYLTSGISKNEDGSLEVKPKKFGILPGLIEPDVLQTMQQIPGIYSADETISNINVRGGTHDQNLFLWNGIRMFQTGHFFGLISAFNPSLAHTIKIYKNGSSAFYGESVSSVVDISSHTKDIKNSSTSIGANLISMEFYTKIKTSSTGSFEISARRSFTDFVSSPTYKKYYTKIFQNTIVTNLNDNQVVDYNSDEDFYFYDFTAQYQKKIGTKNELIIDFIGINNRLQFSQNTIIETASISKSSNLSQQNYGANLNWKTNWDNYNSSQFNFYGSYYNLDSSNQSIESNQISDQQNSVLDTGFRLENQHKINSVFSFNNGYQFNEIGILNSDKINTPSFYRRIKEVLRSHALILETQYQSKENNTLLKTGIRINYLEKFNKFIIEPRIQFNYALTNTLKAEILAEIKSQNASQIIDLQQDFLGVEKRRWTLANDGTVPIQKSQQVSFGFTYTNKNWLITIDNFYKKVTGITSSSQAFQNQLEFLKTNGDYTVLGSEFLIQKNFNHFYTWMSYNFNDNKYSFKEYQTERFNNNFEIEHTVTWAGIYEWHNLKIALGSKWLSGRPITTPLNDEVNLDNPTNPKINYNKPNNERLDDYFQLNFSISHNWNLNSKTKLQMGISVLNVLNKKNVLNRYYRVSTTNYAIESVNIYSLERTPNLSLKVSF